MSSIEYTLRLLNTLYQDTTAAKLSKWYPSTTDIYIPSHYWPYGQSPNMPTLTQVLPTTGLSSGRRNCQSLVPPESVVLASTMSIKSMTHDINVASTLFVQPL